MKKTIAYCILAISLLACKKEVTELPPATETGANTFGAKVDDKFWVPAGFGPVPTAPTLEARYIPNRDLYINARNFSSSPTETEFEFFIKGVRTPGTYLLNSNTAYGSEASNYGYYVKRKITPENEWITSSTHTGSVNFTRVDTVNRIISGTFQFTAGNFFGGAAPLTVAEGRFDIKL
jgi:hypothetical protein